MAKDETVKGVTDNTTEEDEDGDKHVGVFKAISFSVKLSYLTATLRTHCWMGSSSDANMIQENSILEHSLVSRLLERCFFDIITSAQVLLCPVVFVIQFKACVVFPESRGISFDAELVIMSCLCPRCFCEFLMRKLVSMSGCLVPRCFWRVFEAFGLLYVRFRSHVVFARFEVGFLLAFGKGEY